MIRRPGIPLFPPAPAAPGVVAGWVVLARRRGRAGAALFLAVAGLAAAIVLLARPVWRAEAALRLGAPASVGGVSLGGAGSPAGLLSLFQQMTGDPFANELELLASRTVTEGVVRDNALQVQLRAPRGWHRDSLMHSLAAGSETDEAVFAVEWDEDGRVRVRRTAPGDSLVGVVEPGRPARFGGITVAFRPWRPGMPRSVRLATVPEAEAVRRTRERLRAERKRREANLVRISYDHPDPALALAVVRSATTRYAALRAELQRRESGETTDSLRVVAERTLGELRGEEAELERFQRRSRLLAPEAQAEAFVERQTEVVTALARARSELAHVDDVLGRLDAAAVPGAAWAGLIAHPTFLQNQTLGELLGTLVGLEQQRIALAGRRTPADGQMQALERQTAYLDGSLRTLVRQYREGIAAEVAILDGRATEMDATLARAPGEVIELGRRQRALRLLGEVYLFTAQRLRQESLREAVSFASVQTVDPPAILARPVWPRKRLGLGVGVILGAAFAVLGMVLMERADRTVRGAGELRGLAGAPVLAARGEDGEGTALVPPRVRRALRERGGAGRPIVLAPVDDTGAAQALARGLERVAAPEPVPAGAWEAEPPAGTGVVVGPVLADYAAAADAAAAGAVVLVVRAGATRRDDVARAAALLREAGAAADGVVAVGDPHDAAGFAWR